MAEGGEAGGPTAGAEDGGAAADAPGRTYFVYVLECRDGSLYTGITTDVARRLREHLGLEGPGRGARYTRLRGVAGLAAVWETGGRAAASRLEWHAKRLTHAHKLELLAGTTSADEVAGLRPGSCRRLSDDDVARAWAAATRG